MALNRFKAGNDKNNREIAVPSQTPSGSIIVNDDSGIVWVTLTASGDSTITQTLPNGSVITSSNGGVGNKPLGATAARDGSFIFEIDGATDGETVGGSGTDAQTPVFYVNEKTVTITPGAVPADDVVVGIIDDCTIVDGFGAIEIGAI